MARRRGDGAVDTRAHGWSTRPPPRALELKICRSSEKRRSRSPARPLVCSPARPPARASDRATTTTTKGWRALVRQALARTANSHSLLSRFWSLSRYTAAVAATTAAAAAVAAVANMRALCGRSRSSQGRRRCRRRGDAVAVLRQSALGRKAPPPPPLRRTASRRSSALIHAKVTAALHAAAVATDDLQDGDLANGKKMASRARMATFVRKRRRRRRAAAGGGGTRNEKNSRAPKLRSRQLQAPLWMSAVCSRLRQST